MAEMSPADRRAYTRVAQRANLRLRGSAVPVVAAVNGAALELAGRLARLAPVPLLRIRRLLERSDRTSLKHVMRAEAAALEACMGTEDS